MKWKMKWNSHQAKSLLFTEKNNKTKQNKTKSRFTARYFSVAVSLQVTISRVNILSKENT